MRPDEGFYSEPGGENPMHAPRYCGIPTFMRTPHVTDPNGLDIALVAATIMYEILCILAESKARRKSAFRGDCPEKDDSTWHEE